MIIIKHHKENHVVEFVCEGRITHEDYQDVLIPYLEKEFKHQNKPMVALCDLRKMTTMQPQAMWDDYKYGRKHLKDVRRIATVGDKWWIAFAMKIAPLFYPAIAMKHFKGNDYKQALQWVKE